MQPVRVLVNAVSARFGGGATYAIEQIGALARQPGLALTIVAVEPTASVLAERAPAVRLVVVPKRRVLNRLAWEQIILARRAPEFDVVYAIGNFALLLTGTPQVVTFQNPNHFGHAARAVNRRFGSPAHRLRVAAESQLAHISLRRAHAVVAISQALRATMVEDFPQSAPHLVLSAAPSDSTVSAALKVPLDRHQLPSSYALTIANDYPHKDWDGIVRAFSVADDLLPLIVVGAPRSRRRSSVLVRPSSTGSTTRVIMWGQETDRARLDALYRGAEVFIAHSQLEAFPLTPLEALARGVRLVASDIPSHREVCVDRAEYYDPMNPRALIEAVGRALRGPRPEPWLPDRTWDDNARELAAVICAAASGSDV